MNKIEGTHSLGRELSTQNQFISKNIITDGQIDMQVTKGVQKKPKIISILGNWKDFMKRNHVSGTLQTIDRKGAHRTCQRHLGFFLELDNT